MVAVGDQRGAVQPAAGARSDPGGDPVAEVTDRAGAGEHGQVPGRRGVDQARDGLDACHARADEHRGDHGQAGPPLGVRGAEPEGEAQGDRGQRVPEVVDHIGQQGDAVGGDEEDRLRDRGQPENGQ